MSTNYTIVIKENDTLIFSGYFVVNNYMYPPIIIEFYEDGNLNNILAPVGSWYDNNNVFQTLTHPFTQAGVNITTMSYYDGDYGDNVTPPGDGTYNLYILDSDNTNHIANFDSIIYNFIVSTNDPIPITPPGMYYKIYITIRLQSTTIFNGFFVVNNYVVPNIIGFYENGDETTNILAPLGSYGGNFNTFITLTSPFSSVSITTMSYYDENYGLNDNPPPNGDGTYNLYNFTSGNGFIRNFGNTFYSFTTTLANPSDPIPLYPPTPPVPSPPAPLPPPPPVIDSPITYIVCQPCQKSRFCYNYKPPGIIEPCCQPIVCATDALIASLSALPEVVNNSSRTTESSLLQATVKRQQQATQTQIINNTVQSTIANAAAINQNIFNQLIDIRNQRYTPYQPYIYPVVPPSVMELQMRTANVGVPHTVNTIAKCKGSQFVTT
jgi:hypothetical protein